jgi:hypothetical protein
MSSFIDREVKFNKGGDSNFKRTEFMQVGQGAHTIRILQPQVKTLPTHYFEHSKASVLCLEDECPICANNKKLYMQFGKEANKQPGYNRTNWRFFVNVLDKTPARVCSKCGKEYKDTRNTICTCGEVLGEVKNLNKVKVLSKGLMLRDDLGSVNDAIKDNGGNPIGLVNYDITLMVSGAGRDTKITPVPRTDLNEPVPEGLELFDLEKAVITLDANEMLDLFNGHSLKDIFAARKKEEISVESAVDQETIDKVNSAVEKLFNQ